MQDAFDELFDPNRLRALWHPKKDESTPDEGAADEDEREPEPREAAVEAFDELERALGRALGPKVSVMKMQLEVARKLLVAQLGKQRAEEEAAAAAAAAASGETPPEGGEGTPAEAPPETPAETPAPEASAGGAKPADEKDPEDELGSPMSLDAALMEMQRIGGEADTVAEAVESVMLATEKGGEWSETLEPLEGPELEKNRTDLGTVLDEIEDLYEALKAVAR